MFKKKLFFLCLLCVFLIFFQDVSSHLCLRFFFSLHRAQGWLNRLTLFSTQQVNSLVERARFLLLPQQIAINVKAALAAVGVMNFQIDSIDRHCRQALGKR